ncbi:hypothetical protein I3760_06G010200 [Carya illinoinensis]|nr:hypothetical protein I3760_06G010200 [Carya illinoinensis]
MASSSEQTSTHPPHSHPISLTENALIALNISTQINEKLTPSTFPQWRAQFEALLIGYNLLDYVNGISKCPSPVGTSSTELNKTHWVRQDKLILSAILASISTTITPLIATAKTSHEAWQKLNHMYASKSRTRAMQLKEELTLIQEIVAPIRARETSLAFEELHNILVGHESYLRRLEMKTQQLVTSANFSYRNKPKSGGSQSKGTYKASGPSRPQGQNRNFQAQQNRKPSNPSN